MQVRQQLRLSLRCSTATRRTKPLLAAVRACSALVVNDNCDSSGYCGLPTMYQYFKTDAEAA